MQEAAARRAHDGGGGAQREGVYVFVDADSPTRHGTLEVLAPSLRPAVMQYMCRRLRPLPRASAFVFGSARSRA